jgi:hypothetical protein
MKGEQIEPAQAGSNGGCYILGLILRGTIAEIQQELLKFTTDTDRNM